jgi:hypothetical protein
VEEAYWMQDASYSVVRKICYEKFKDGKKFEVK